MKKNLLFLFLLILLNSCGSSKRTTSSSVSEIKKERSVKSKKVKRDIITGEVIPERVKSDNIIENVIDYAKTFEGTRYKYGGTTSAGMDCSGLVYTAFQKENIALPRVSKEMATKGVLISLKDTEEGDLLFFKTSSKNNITHVGLVIENKHGEILFIHSTSQRGVIVSSLDEDYWKKAFVEVRRVI